MVGLAPAQSYQQVNTSTRATNTRPVNPSNKSTATKKKDEDEAEPTNTSNRPPKRTTKSANPPTGNSTEQSNSYNQQPQASQIFCSRFPQLEIDTFENDLGKYSLVLLRDAIAKQNSRRTKAHKDIKDLVKIVQMEFEKRILMIALMAGVPEVKTKANPWIWFLSFCIECLGNPHPLFFALANLPDYSNTNLESSEVNEDEEDDSRVNVQQFDSTTPAPEVYQLSEAEKVKYQPIFDRLVNVEKLHLSHGKPEPAESLVSLQKKSLVAFSIVCHRYHIAYYMTTAGCGGVNGWSQTFSNSVSFAHWALETSKIPQTFSTYVHGKDTAKEIESKPPQASDERRSRLGTQLNALVDAHVSGMKFPKQDDPFNRIAKKGWPIQIVQKPGALLKRADILKGHQKVTDAVVKLWLKDIENGTFAIESISIQHDQNLDNEDDEQN
ncbi:hypothetical protein DFH28DRAFT_1082160 [Melampsora americana]|nr:hypothetical protein DFH28DRAFT_1082160 [Melampsora americana]